MRALTRILLCAALLASAAAAAASASTDQHPGALTARRLLQDGATEMDGATPSDNASTVATTPSPTAASPSPSPSGPPSSSPSPAPVSTTMAGSSPSPAPEASPAAPSSTQGSGSSPAPSPSPSPSCLAPRTLEDATKPFCYQPDTISAEAKAFLASAAAGASPLAASNSSPEAQVAAIRQVVAQIFRPLHEAAVSEYLGGATRNESVAGVRVLVGVPKGVSVGKPAATKMLLYIHGGGYTAGSCDIQLNTVAATATGAGLVIMCPEYRLAPEHPFPAGLNDVLNVYKALVQQGYSPRNIVLLGDSAGGGMVAAVAVQLQRERVALPAALGMFSPWADLGVTGDTGVTLLGVDPLLTSASVNGALYVGGDTSKFADPLVSPLRADYAALFPNASLPPTLIQVGLREILLSNSVLLYHRMCAAGGIGRVAISPYEGMWHVFQAFDYVPEARAAAREMAAFFTAALR